MTNSWEQKSSSCPVINRLFIKSRFQSRVGTSSLSLLLWLLLAGPGQNTALGIFLKDPIILRQRCVSVLTAMGHVPALLSEVKDGGTLFLPAFLLQQGPERRAPWKEFVGNAPEVKDCLEEKAEVKIKNRKSARRVQTGAVLSLGPWSYCGRAQHSGWF